MSNLTTREMRFFVSDIETARECFIFGGRFLDTGEIVKFKINRWQNDLYKIINFIQRNPDIWYVGFNFLAFDSQVIEWIVREHESWHDKTNLEICAMIALRGGDCIDDQHYEIQPRIRVEWLSFRIIDLYKVHHFDNEANRCGLKWLEIMMDIPNVAEMPIHHDRTDLTEEECEMIEEYWINDLDATETFLRITMGETEQEMYKGNNMLQIRLDTAAKFGFPLRSCLNWSDTKMGEQINLVGYCKLKGIKQEEVYELKKKRKATKPFTFGQCIPEYVKFQTPQFQAFYESIRKTRVILHKKLEYPFSYNGTSYMIAKGGIHSKDPKRILMPGTGWFLRDADVGSQYPNAIVKRRLFPRHLGEEWLINFDNTIHERIADKKASKAKDVDPEQKRILEGLAEAKKKALNAGGFGMTNQADSWQYDPFITFSCTIGNQFEILMLIETLELKGIRCVSANTDGIVCLVPEELDKTYYDICHEWERIVGNDKIGILEYKDYEQLVQENVNCYMGIIKGEKPKVKGRFAYQVLLNKNNTKDVTRIQRKAMQEYFDKGTPIERTIRECEDIFMFIFGYKSRAFDFIATDKAGKTTNLGGLVRCFASTEGIKLTKTKEEDENSKAGVTRLIGDSYVTAYNTHIDIPFPDRKVNYQWYIDKTLEITRAIEAAKFTGGVKKKKPPPPPDPAQGSLF